METAPLKQLANVLVEIICTLNNAIETGDELHAATAVGCLLNLTETNKDRTSPWDIFMYAAFGTRDEMSPTLAVAADTHFENKIECDHCINLDRVYETFSNVTYNAAKNRLNNTPLNEQ